MVVFFFGPSQLTAKFCLCHGMHISLFALHFKFFVVKSEHWCRYFGLSHQLTFSDTIPRWTIGTSYHELLAIWYILHSPCWDLWRNHEVSVLKRIKPHLLYIYHPAEGKPRAETRKGLLLHDSPSYLVRNPSTTKRYESPCFLYSLPDNPMLRVSSLLVSYIKRLSHDLWQTAKPHRNL